MVAHVDSKALSADLTISCRLCVSAGVRKLTQATRAIEVEGLLVHLHTRCIMMLSPTSDTRNLVVQAYDGHANYSCSKCSAVIVSLSFPLSTRDCKIHADSWQALQDELISKSFSGRDGRG